MDEPGEMLATRRSKRSTAGNRMEAALAEMNLEEVDKDADDDQDFENLNDEEDVFGSDFASTDEEADATTAEAAEREAAEDERKARKTAKSRLEKATAAAHARNKASFAPEQEESQLAGPSKQRPKSKLHQVLVMDDEETGEIVKRDLRAGKRVSSRKHTVLNTSATVSRLKQSQLRRATLPKKAKTEHKHYTQAQLIAKALDNEEGNIKQHRDYLKTEEEKRRKARIIRTAVEGPLLRWISKEGEDKVPIPPLPPPSAQPLAPTTSSLFSGSTYKPAGQTFIQSPYTFASASNFSSSLMAGNGTAGSSTPFQAFQYYSSSTAFPTWPPQSLPSSHQSHYTSTTGAPLGSSPATTTTSIATPLTTATAASPPVITPPVPGNTVPTPAKTTIPGTGAPSTTPVLTKTPTEGAPGSTTAPESIPKEDRPQPTSPPAAPPLDRPTPNPHPNSASTAPSNPPEPQFRVEKTAKNFLVHELGQKKGGPKPSWVQTMTALFGDHVKWDEVKVFAGKGRPLSRPKHVCPITGLPANYFDSRTGVHFATSEGYKILTELMDHHYEWDPSFGAYLNEDTDGLDEAEAMQVDE